MNWLLHNAIADLYGPYFLLFYAMTIVAIVAACYSSIRRADRTKDLELPPIRGKVDPYEIAYLRGGPNEVARVAIASLMQRGLLRITEKTNRLSTSKEIDGGRKPSHGELSPLESVVFEWPGYPATPSRIFQPSGIPAALKEFCARYQDDLGEKNLLAPRNLRTLGSLLWALGAMIIIGLGGYKLSVALGKGHHNVAFLVLLCVVGVSVLALVCFALPRTSNLGSAYLEQLKLAYGGLKSQVHPVGSVTSALTMAGDPGSRGRLRDPAAYSDCLLMVGIFGMASLAETPLSDLTSMFKRGGAASSACCGAGATGGCGGGGGGCGGGGCGGGGCGGCGGG
jgi:uncharacterized protein (TIGR04222 family)